MTYLLKHIPEDFVVKEKSKAVPKTHGRYCYALLRKKQRNTLDVVKEVARLLHIKEKQVGFAGSKDKQGITEQVISILRASKEKIENLKLSQAALLFLGCGDTPISLGDLEGNAFEIVVRDLPLNFSKEEVTIKPFMENYFDEQRFSTQNVAVGKALLKKNFAEAVKLIHKDACEQHLEEHPSDFVGALKKIPLRLLRMYVNAFQSSIWNRTVAEYLQKNGIVKKTIASSQGDLVFVDNVQEFHEMQIPLVGFGELETSSLEIREIISRLLKEEGITSRDFVVKQIPELTVEGEARFLAVPLSEITVGEVEDDDLLPGKKKIKVGFALPKGSYATMVIKKVFQGFS